MDVNPLMGLMGDSDESDESSYDEEEDYSDDAEPLAGAGGDDSDDDDPLAIKSSSKDRKGKGGGKADSRKIRKLETLLDRANVKMDMQKDIITSYESHLQELEAGLEQATTTLEANDKLIEKMQVTITNHKLNRGTNDWTVQTTTRDRIASFQATIEIQASADAIEQKKVQKTKRSKSTAAAPGVEGGGGGGGAVLADGMVAVDKKFLAELQTLKSEFDDKIKQTRDEMQQAFEQQVAKETGEQTTKHGESTQRMEKQVEGMQTEMARLAVALAVTKKKASRARKRKGARKGLLVTGAGGEKTEKTKPRRKKKAANLAAASLTKQYENMMVHTHRATVVMSNFHQTHKAKLSTAGGGSIFMLRIRELGKETRELKMQIAEEKDEGARTALEAELAEADLQLQNLQLAQKSLDEDLDRDPMTASERYSGIPADLVKKALECDIPITVTE